LPSPSAEPDSKFTGGAERYYMRTGKELPGFKLVQDVTDLATGVVDGALGALGLTKRQSQTLTEYSDGLLWAGPVSIGTPAQEFTINFDTVSSSFCPSSSPSTPTKGYFSPSVPSCPVAEDLH